MQYKLLLTTKTLADVSDIDCDPYGDKFPEEPAFRCWNDAQIIIATHNGTELRKVCLKHFAEGWISAYEQVCRDNIISTFPSRQRKAETGSVNTNREERQIA